MREVHGQHKNPAYSTTRVCPCRAERVLNSQGVARRTVPTIASAMSRQTNGNAKRHRILAGVALILILGSGRELSAAIVFDFDTGTGQGVSSDPLLVTASDFQASGVTNFGFDGPGTSGSNAVRGQGFQVGNSAATSNYYYFDLTIAPDILLQLTTLTFDEFALDGPGPHQGPDTFQIVVNGAAIGSPQATNINSYGATHSIDLSTLTFLNETVRVEFHGWGAFNSNQHNEWFLDNVNLGFETSVVPEPSTNLLLACSFGFLCLNRRRAKRRAVTA